MNYFIVRTTYLAATIIFILFLLSCASQTNTRSNLEQNLVTNEKLKEIWPNSKMVGKKITGIRFTRLNKADGTIDGYAVGVQDTGVWEIDGDTVCHHFKKWRSGIRECLTIYKNGIEYDAYTPDGNYWASFKLNPL